MAGNLMAAFAAHVLAAAQGEVVAALKAHAEDPRAFRRWCGEHLRSFQAAMTVDDFLRWLRDNRAEVQKAIDDAAPAAVRELDNALLAHGAAIEKEVQAEAARNRPVEPDTQRQPPSRQELMDAHFMAGHQDYFSTAGQIEGRPRGVVRRPPVMTRRRP